MTLFTFDTNHSLQSLGHARKKDEEELAMFREVCDQRVTASTLEAAKIAGR